MGSTAASAPGVPDLVSRVQDAYNAHRFIDAYNLSLPFWDPSTDPSKFSIHELVLAGRLAARLGGLRLSRRLLMLAREREPWNPLVRYFAIHLRNPGVRLIDELRAFEEEPDLGGAAADLRASWFASFAFRWAKLRDFSRAQDCIRRAHELESERVWVLSCESNVFAMMDDWQAALRCAEQAVSLDPAAHYAIDPLSTALLHLGRIDESAHRTFAAAGSTQSYQVVQTACWHQCALAETVDETARGEALQRARRLANRLDELAPLADRESKAMFARARLDIAELADNHEEMERWTGEVRSHFHRRVLANLKKNPHGQRIRLPFRRVIQKYVECVPTSIASALEATGVTISVAEMATAITFGGTSEWAAADWLKKRGLHVRFFAVTADIAARLIKAGIAFTATWDDDQTGHAVAIVGLDEAAETVLVHDPQSVRGAEYLLSTFASDYSPLGMLGLAAVPAERASELDSILPPEAALAEAAQAYRRTLTESGPSAARLVVDGVSKQFPSHPGTRYLKAEQALEEGRTGEAFALLRNLLELFPHSAIVRSSFLNACRALGNTALLRQTLRSIAETGSVPGLKSQQEWVRPHERYICEYADLLRLSSETADHSESLLHSALRKNPMLALAWHTLADLYSGSDKNAHALLAYRLGSLLSESNEHFARAYADELWRYRRTDQAGQWLERRAHTFGSSPRAVSTWVTLIAALEDWGQPDAALAACATALKKHAGSAELLVFIVPFLARMGDWEAAESELQHLERGNNPPRFHEAATFFYSMQGKTTEALGHAESWVREAPRSVFARNTLLDLVARSVGSRAALERATRWIEEQPANEQMEHLFCRHCEEADWRKLRLLRRRLKRNRDDGWAWREAVFVCFHHYEVADESRRRRLKPQILSWLSECDRTSSDEIGTLNAHALWKEANGDWQGAVRGYLRSIRQDPSLFWPYRRAWQCSCRFESQERQRLWDEIHPLLLQTPGRLSNAREITPLLVERFGIREVEKIVEGWRQQRPDDPDILEAQADLLLEHGHGRSDAERALELLKPAVERYPYNTGLRMSLAGAYRALGNHGSAIAVLRDVVRRHPSNTGAMIRLAWALYRNGNFAEYEEILSQAAERDPRNPQVFLARAEILIDRKQLDQARAVIHEGLTRLERNVPMREVAITRLGECGCYEEAIVAARQGIVVYPRGAYLWFLLASTLSDMPQFAEKGEIESCLRRSLKLNCALFQAADLLAVHLTGQRRFAEAIAVIAAIEPNLCDPSSARGRLAWIKRQQGKKSEAVEEMAAALAAAPWYAWGWNSLSSWLEEDGNQKEARQRLEVVPPQMLTNVQFRLQRLQVLEKAGTNVQTLNEEWNSLLSDFPEDVFLHLRRYDSLRESKHSDKAAVILEKILPVAPTNPYVLARLVEVRLDQNRSEDAQEAALKVCFAPVEESVWPVNKTWDSLSRLEAEFWHRMRIKIEAGEKPTLRAVARFSEYAMKKYDRKRANQGLAGNWLPRPGARELQRLLKRHVPGWGDDRYCAQIFGLLTSYGYQRLVLRNWKAMERTGVEPSTALWAEVGRAMVGVKRDQGRRFLQDWRTRAGVAMWMVANYTLCLSRFRTEQLHEIVASCREALNALRHDHCARYLVHMQAEACALLGQREALLAIWEQQANYFDGQLEAQDYFDAEDKHLLSDIPMLVGFLQQGQYWSYGTKLWAIRLKRLWRPQRFKSPYSNLMRWLVIVAFLILLQVLRYR